MSAVVLAVAIYELGGLSINQLVFLAPPIVFAVQRAICGKSMDCVGLKAHRFYDEAVKNW